MGKRHRQRTAASAHRVHADASSSPADSFGGGDRYDPRVDIDALVQQGVSAATGGASDAAPLSIAGVIARLEAIDRDDLIDDIVVRHVGPLVSGVWERGWSPLDLVHATHHEFSRGIAGLVADMALADATLQRPDRPDAWTDQLERVRIRRGRRSTSPDDFGKLADRFLLARFLVTLPRVVPVVMPPSAWRTAAAAGAAAGERRADEQVDPRMLERVRALLAKAESTTFEAEADAFMGKAQELMARYAIDAAMVAAASALSGVSSLAAGVQARRLHLDDPYAKEKAQLLGAVASVNGGRVVWHDGWGFATVMGFPVELDLVELTFTSLLVQMTRAMATAGASGGRTRSPAFRRAFVLSFAQRIQERLGEARHRASEEASAHYGGALVPVQAARRAAVQERADEWFPDTTPMRSRSVDAGGWYAGRTAADVARLEPGLGEIR
jgi:Protein of unknown function (DUF2786)